MQLRSRRHSLASRVEDVKSEAGMLENRWVERMMMSR